MSVTIYSFSRWRHNTIKVLLLTSQTKLTLNLNLNLTLTLLNPSVFTAADDKQVTVLVGLDLSVAFDTVNHDTLLQRLETEFGVTGTVLSWLQSYLSGRSQFVKLGNHQSPAVSLNVGVPQGSVLGPILFAVYCSPVGDVIAGHGVQYHQYADDTQLHLAMRADNTAVGLSVLAVCTSDVRLW